MQNCGTNFGICIERHGSYVTNNEFKRWAVIGLLLINRVVVPNLMWYRPLGCDTATFYQHHVQCLHKFGDWICWEHTITEKILSFNKPFFVINGLVIFRGRMPGLNLFVMACFKVCVFWVLFLRSYCTYKHFFPHLFPARKVNLLYCALRETVASGYDDVGWLVALSNCNSQFWSGLCWNDCEINYQIWCWHAFSVVDDLVILANYIVNQISGS